MDNHFFYNFRKCIFGFPAQFFICFLGISNQYCEPWARQQENYLLGLDGDQLRAMHEDVRKMLGFSIHPPFMGHFGGRHPERMIAPRASRFAICARSWTDPRRLFTSTQSPSATPIYPHG